MSVLNVNGMDIYYEVRGDLSSDKVIAFFNGVVSQASSWDYFSDFFVKAGFKVILHDFKGQGASSKPDIDYTFEIDADNAKALFDHLGVKKLYLAGLSYGGIIAQRFALKYQSCLEGLILINTLAKPEEMMKFLDMGFITDLRESEKPNPKSIFYRMLAVSYSKEYLEKNSEALRKRIEAMPSIIKEDFYKGFLGLCQVFIDDKFNTDELKKIKVPSLIISCAGDRFCPTYYSDEIYEKIPHAEYFVIKGSGHAVAVEKPDALLSLIWGFVNKPEVNKIS